VELRAMSGLVREPHAPSGLVRDCADAPERRSGNDATAVREVIGSGEGCELFTLRVLRTVAGRSFERSTGEADELLFVVGGGGRLIAGDGEHQLEPEAGALLAGGQRYELDNDGPEDLSIVSVALHDPLHARTAAKRGHISRAWRTRPPRRPPPTASSGSSSTPTTAAPRRPSSSATSRSAPLPPTTTSTTR
jgi:mannose-6-phosphate isomerase-like protein (cupin superfamily)